MNKVLLLIVVLLIVGLLGAGAYSWFKSETITVTNQTGSLELNILDAPEGRLPALYTCDGEDINPPLSWRGVPREAASLVLVVDDISAESGHFFHWLVWNVNPKDEGTRAGNLPMGANTGTGSTGRVGYVGPCPPSGDHQYVFKLLALDTTLTLPVSTTWQELEQALTGHIISETEARVKYERP